MDNTCALLTSNLLSLCPHKQSQVPKYYTLSIVPMPLPHFYPEDPGVTQKDSNDVSIAKKS